jgi:hypothetical protein
MFHYHNELYHLEQVWYYPVRINLVTPEHMLSTEQITVKLIKKKFAIFETDSS